MLLVAEVVVMLVAAATDPLELPADEREREMVILPCCCLALMPGANPLPKLSAAVVVVACAGSGNPTAVVVASPPITVDEN